MKILMLHNRYQIRGGEDESTDLEISLLQDRGHTVELMEDFNDGIAGLASKVAAAGSAIWNEKWRKRIRDRLNGGRFDILHVQNHFPNISPSVYYAGYQTGVPVVQAVRNYRIVCPSANLFREGRYCADCIEDRFKFSAVKHRCYRQSRVGSATLSLSSALHASIGTWNRRVTRYAAISKFVGDRLVQGGVPQERVVIKPNFVFSDPQRKYLSREKRRHLLYVGRIAPEKGIDILFEAYKQSGTSIPLKVAGGGSVPTGFPEGVEILGRKEPHQIYDLMAEAIAVIMPGSWPEPFGRVAIESFAVGTPVIAADAGGLGEIVVDGRNGFKVKVGDVSGFADCLKIALANNNVWSVMSRNAILDYRELYSPEANYTRLIDIYSDAIQSKSAF